MNIKGILKDKETRQKILNLIYSIGAVAVFNLITQIAYWYFKHRLGDESHGVILSVISLIAITAGTFGYAVNCARMLGLEKGRTNNGDYNLILLAMGFLGSLIGIGYLFQLGITSPVYLILYVVLMYTTMIRYYADVEFRLNVNFFRYMIFYLLISLGYVAGLFVFKLTGIWMLTLILGESLAFLYVLCCGSIFRAPFLKPSEHFRPILASIWFLLISTLIENVALHADRIVLLAITGEGEYVSTYYIASLAGKIIAMLTVPINSLIISYLVRYKGGLTRKLWTVVIGVAIIGGVLGFLGCMLISPVLINLLSLPAPMEALKTALTSDSPVKALLDQFFFNDSVEAIKYMLPAVLGQIFYFVSGVLALILLRFKGEKKQFIFNTAYAVEFFAVVIVGTLLGDLNGFVWAIVIANAVRFVAAIVWGFLGKKKPPENTEAVEANAQPEA
ncbi:MAG: hypothetical protein IJW44_00815 [Clostridia bacterium]|nr:hypothetical protein [Clostridia bacterium]